MTTLSPRALHLVKTFQAAFAALDDFKSEERGYVYEQIVRHVRSAKPMALLGAADVIEPLQEAVIPLSDRARVELRLMDGKVNLYVHDEMDHDSLRSHLATLTRERDEARQELDSLRETLQDLADDLCGLQPVMTMDECVVAITQHDLKLRQENERMRPVFEAAKKVVAERRARIMHARETKAMCDLQRAIDTAPSVSTEYLRGIDDSIARVKSRQAHYELYREGDMMKTHPATFAILDEVLVFLGSLREQALSTKDPSDE